MPKKKNDLKPWETKDTPAGKFAARLREVAGKKGICDIDGLVRLSPRIKHAAATRWWFASRLPKPENIVDLSRALEIDPMAMIKGLGLDLRTVACVEAIVRVES